MNVRSIETRHCDAGWRNYHSARDPSGGVDLGQLEESEGLSDSTSVEPPR